MPTFPEFDPVGPDGHALDEPQLRVIREVIAPHAAEVDVSGVPRSHLDALARVGLFGQPLTPVAAQRELAELLSGSDASTWFCWVQHQSPLTILDQAVETELTPGVKELQERLLPGMKSGELVNAVAFAHVRRPGPPNPVARRTSGGWILDGTLDWVTSWDIADLVMVMAQGEGEFADYLVCCYLPAGRSGITYEGIDVGDPLALLALAGTHTRPVRLTNCFVPDSHIGAVLDRSAWFVADAQRTADPNPSAFGLTRGALSELFYIADARDDDDIRLLAGRLIEECRHLRRRSYELIDATDRKGSRTKRLELRARSLDLASRAATAVVVSRAGAAMMMDSSAGRRAREALFLFVQAQTADTRRASIQQALSLSALA